MFDFTQGDLGSNRAGHISARQREWLDRFGSTARGRGGATLWAALAFLPIPIILILALFLMNRGPRALLISSLPILAAAGCLVVTGILVFAYLGGRKARGGAAEPLVLDLRIAEGRAELGETHSARWGTGYFLTVAETRFNIDARGKFQDGERYRVYHVSSPAGNIILSHERIS